jgi:hypothetical protein
MRAKGEKMKQIHESMKEEKGVEHNHLQHFLRAISPTAKISYKPANGYLPYQCRKETEECINAILNA